jgi:hypothetical protein
MRYSWIIGVAACGSPSLDAEDLSARWTGRFDGDATCASGDLTMDLHRGPTLDDLEGTVRFDTVDDWAGEVHALYDLRAALTGDVMVFQQSSIFEADALPSWKHWCTGWFELTPDANRLTGEWMAADCDCRGDVTFDRG